MRCPEPNVSVRAELSDAQLRRVKIMIDMIGDEHVHERDRELFLGHLVTWGSLVAALVLAITLTHFNSAEKEESEPPAHAEAAS